jgi:hypothetical protein
MFDAHLTLGDYESAGQALDRAEDLLSDISATLTSPTLSVSATSLYEDMVDARISLAEQNARQGAIDQVFSAALRSRVQETDRLWDSSRFQRALDAEPELAKQFREATIALKMVAETPRAIAGEGRSTLERRRSERDAMAAMILDDPSSIGVEAPAYELTPEQLRELLQPNELLLFYQLGKQHRMLWSISKDEISRFEIDTAAPLEAWTERLLEEISRPGTRADAYQQAVAGLRTTLLSDQLNLSSYDRVMVSADGIVSKLPLDALLALDSDDMEKAAIFDTTFAVLSTKSRPPMCP